MQPIVLQHGIIRLQGNYFILWRSKALIILLAWAKSYALCMSKADISLICLGSLHTQINSNLTNNIKAMVRRVGVLFDSGFSLHISKLSSFHHLKIPRFNQICVASQFSVSSRLDYNTGLLLVRNYSAGFS